MRENEIRPARLFKRFLYLSSLDVKRYFNKSKTKINCIACGKKGKFSFKKKNFSYCECVDCKTLFLNPRPAEKDFLNYYTFSSSIKFLANTLYKQTQEARREKIFKPRVKKILGILKTYKVKNYNCIDIGGGNGIFATEMSKHMSRSAVVIEPAPSLVKKCKEKKLIVIPKFLEFVKKKDLPKTKKVFTCFELIEHLHNPSKFIKNVKKLMSKGDLLIFTTLSSTGADILTLWDDSRSINPPHHINFFNPKSIKIFLNKTGLKVLKISTPGKIDIDILNNDKSLIKDRFWKTFISLSSESDKAKMQSLISNINFSSHLMVVCQK